MIKRFDFNDINLIPKKCIVNSRNECDTSVKLGNYTFDLPFVPANMESVINEDIAIKLAKNNLFYIMHRFDIDNYEFTKRMQSQNLIASISIGVKDNDYKLIDKFHENNKCPEFITIDIAHGHAESVKNIIQYINQKLPDTFIIAGNVATIDGAFYLQDAGCHAVKLGVGPGSACVTYMETGFGTRNMQAFSLQQIVNDKSIRIPIIVDGGLINNGDIAKSIVLGATMCMSGNLINGCKDSPGELIIKDGEMYKEYWGSASSAQSGKTNRIEGIKKLIPYKHKTVLEQLTYIKESLQSAISYGGGNKLSDLKYVRYYF